MQQAASLLGGKLESGQEGFKITFNGTAADLHINKGPNNVWKASARKAIVEAITMQLNARLVDPGTDDIQEEDESMEDDLGAPAASVPNCDIGAEQKAQDTKRPSEKRKGRKDLYGIGNAIDRFATNAVLANKASTLAKKYKELLEEAGLKLNTKDTSSDPIVLGRKFAKVSLWGGTDCMS